MAPNSEVQDRALVLLDVMEMNRESERRAEDRIDRIKAVAALTDYDTAMSWWDEFKPRSTADTSNPQDPWEQARRPDGTYDPDMVDETQIEWAVPTPEEDEANREWIASREQQFSVTGEELNPWI